jgi:hypothetical protein
MALIETALRDYLLADASIAAAVVDRVYPDVLPQNPTLPAMTYTRISTRSPELVDGNPDLLSALFQIACWSTSRLGAATLASYVRTRMIGVGGSGFQKGGIEDERSDEEPDTRRYRQDLDCTIFYAASTP